MVRPETDEVTVIKSDEELHRLFEELKRESEAIYRGDTRGSRESRKTIAFCLFPEGHTLCRDLSGYNPSLLTPSPALPLSRRSLSVEFLIHGNVFPQVLGVHDH